MALTIQEILAAKGVNPSDEHLRSLEAKWAETLELKGDLNSINLDDADIALRNIPGGDHIG